MPQASLAWQEFSDFGGIAALAIAAVAIAALVGLAVGIEREWSGHASGPQARFARVRTFLLLGLLGGSAGLLTARGQPIIGAVVAAGSAAFIVVAYAMSVRREGVELDGTTELAALVVLTLGVLAGFGQLALSAGVGAVVAIALREKERLHGAIRHIGDEEMQVRMSFGARAARLESGHDPRRRVAPVENARFPAHFFQGRLVTRSTGTPRICGLSASRVFRL